MDLSSDIIDNNYFYIFKFENDFKLFENKNWFNENWTKSIGIALMYAITIFTIQNLMKNYKRFELKGLLILWNTVLALFSGFAFLRSFPQFYHILKNHGIHKSICAPTYFEKDPVTSFWACMFVTSKAYELGDTLFIVLRKQKLIFLHWYHHITVLVYSWYTYGEVITCNNMRNYMVMNVFVHTLMYTYYAAKAAKLSPPRFISIVITALQLTQMIIGSIVTFLAAYYKINGKSCYITNINILISSIIYLSYFILFGKFFYDAYIAKKSTSFVKKTK